MNFITLLGYLSCTSNQQNDNPLISSDGHDIRTVIKDIKKFIKIDHPNLYEEMKKENYFEKNNENIELENIYNKNIELENINNENIYNINNNTMYENIELEKNVNKVNYKKKYRKILPAPYPKKKNKNIDQSYINNHFYATTEDEKVLLVLIGEIN